ncbi:MAG: Icc protein [Gammaproteobacteria bacterium]|jgi:Icc protein
MLVAQLTDFHALPPGRLLDGVDTNAMLEHAIVHVGQLRTAPDLLIATGDLAEGGALESYTFLREQLSRLAMPWLLTVGNHDSRDNLRAVFGDLPWVPGSGYINYVVDDYPVRLLALDTLDVGRSGGTMCPTRLQWLDQTLSQAQTKPTLLFMHHPPFDSGIAWMDKSAFDGGPALAEIIRAHPQVKRIICGHLHRPITSEFAGVVTSVASSTCYQVHLDLAPSAVPQIIFEPCVCHLHHWDGERFVTHQTYISPCASPIALCPKGP